MMTRRERLGRDQIVKVMSQAGYPTYADLFSLFDLHLTADPEVIGYCEVDRAVICLNENLDIDQAVTVVKHEILHEWLTHYKRALAHNIDESDASLHELSNIAADYEISNLGYTEKDKSTARRIMLNGKICKGLVTEDKHPDWVDKPFEEMYDLLLKEREQLKDFLSQLGPQIGQKGNSSIQGMEDQKRRAEAAKEKAGDSAQSGGNSSQDSGEDNPQESNGSSGGDSDSEKEGQSSKNTSSGSGSGQEKKRPTYDDEEYQNMSPEEKKKERARRRKQLAKELQEKADKVIDQLEDEISKTKDKKSGKEDGEPFETPEEIADREQRVAKIRRILDSVEKQTQALNENSTAIRKEIEDKRARDSARWRNNSLTRFTESLNKFIRDQIARARNDSWSHINKKYVYSGLLRPGKSMAARGAVPLINVYFDRSGSWDSEKTKMGAQAISTLNKYVTRGEIVMKLYYFNDEVLETDPGGNGGTKLQPVLNHIEQTKPNNVILLTDSDTDHERIDHPVTVPGAVWKLFYQGRSSAAIQNLIGLKLDKSFDVTQ